MTTRLKDWLEISTEGFAQRQADRKPEHLLKELVQNALDAVSGTTLGTVDITLAPGKLGRKKVTVVTVADNGPGISDPSDLRTVFCTSKTDSFLLRGRLGQGFKEVLCMALEAQINSREGGLRFHVENGQRVTDLVQLGSSPTSELLRYQFPGTRATMWMGWPESSHPSIVKYLHSLVPPAGTRMTVNGQEITKRIVEHEIECSLRTELFQEGKWVRRERTGQVELISPAFPGEDPMIYEMGIPIQEIEWTQPYHINVQMRVPMNPRRDAVAAGYLKDLYRQVLPTLMPQLEPEQLRDEWVSLAVEEAAPELRREIITTAFGEDAVRSVPTMGRRDWDSDAREMGLQPINTSLLPKGLRDAAMEILPTSRDAELQRRETVNIAFTNPVRREADGPLKAFIAWLAGQLVNMPVDVRITETLIIRGQDATAAWAEGGRLTLNNQARAVWRDPLSEPFLGLLVHEVAHENAGHHGDAFRTEVERMAGKLARLCLSRPEEIKQRHEQMLRAIDGQS